MMVLDGIFFLIFMYQGNDQWLYSNMSHILQTEAATAVSV